MKTTTQLFGPMLALLLMAACSQAKRAGEAPGQVSVAELPRVTVYKSPTCGCCGAWVDHLREDGFFVDVIEQADISARKVEFGVPPAMGSCHTATVDGYVIEGHVPSADIRRLLNERPRAKGLAVPGMPIGSPGMEMGDRRDAYTVWLLADDVGPKAFARHGQAP